MVAVAMVTMTLQNVCQLVLNSLFNFIFPWTFCQWISNELDNFKNKLYIHFSLEPVFFPIIFFPLGIFLKLVQSITFYWQTTKWKIRKFHKGFPKKKTQFNTKAALTCYFIRQTQWSSRKTLRLAFWRLNTRIRKLISSFKPNPNPKKLSRFPAILQSSYILVFALFTDSIYLWEFGLCDRKTSITFSYSVYSSSKHHRSIEFLRLIHKFPVVC